MPQTSKAPADFVAEAAETLEALSQGLSRLDGVRDASSEPDPDTVNHIFRAAHSLKGLTSMFAQDRMTRLAHSAEDLLDGLRLGKVTLSAPVLDALLESVDLFHLLLSEAS
ncbi:MAG TPA: Hpt domain-containing protein, partial [Myxococcaceae bacterium]|nr:Hpt domain-containing protein [Myxococcaceae bacterium]